LHAWIVLISPHLDNAREFLHFAFLEGEGNYSGQVRAQVSKKTERVSSLEKMPLFVSD